MNINPYAVLGLSEASSIEEVKEAYRNLARQYQEDFDYKKITSEIFTEKMDVLNEAYDSIILNSGTNWQSKSSNSQTQVSYSTSPEEEIEDNPFSDIEKCIQENRIDDAEMLLDGIPDTMRNAQWYFLKGTVLQARGWLEEAYAHYERAYRTSPNNKQYRNAYHKMNRARSSGYRKVSDDSSGRGCLTALCGGAICTSLCCDCCSRH